MLFQEIQLPEDLQLLGTHASCNIIDRRRFHFVLFHNFETQTQIMAIFCRQRVVVAVALKTGLPYIDKVTGSVAISVWVSIRYLLFQYRAQLSLQVRGFSTFLIKSVISNKLFIEGV